ncbi:MAG: formate dehydrogenase accessory sulfurtransferase FdhD [Chitinophagales bacterium]
MISTAKNKLEKETQKFQVKKISGSNCVDETDAVVKEAPLEISIAYGSTGNRKKELLAVTMRTPGNDFNMVTGWLFAEHMIQRSSDVVSIRFTGNFDAPELQENALLIELAPDVIIDLSTKKKFITNSACGFCGSGAFDVSSHEGTYIPLDTGETIPQNTISRLPELIQSCQGVFSITGGSHAVALFSFEGELLSSFEDVGRHNAMDKLIGYMLKQQSIPLSNRIAVFSGRLSYELVQKALAAGIPVVCSIGAPTSLAIELATDFNMTVIGFLKKERMNIYCGAERIALNKPAD